MQLGGHIVRIKNGQYVYTDDKGTLENVFNVQSLTYTCPVETQEFPQVMLRSFSKRPSFNVNSSKRNFPRRKRKEKPSVFNEEEVKEYVELQKL